MFPQLRIARIWLSALRGDQFTKLNSLPWNSAWAYSCQALSGAREFIGWPAGRRICPGTIGERVHPLAGFETLRGLPTPVAAVEATRCCEGCCETKSSPRAISSALGLR